MFIGSNYVITDSAKSRTSLGWSRIQVMERVLSHTVSRPKLDGTIVRAHHYILICLVDSDEFAMIDQAELHEEVMVGYYQLTPEVVGL